ncbi:MAG: hypothetical protein WKF79_04685 [Nocardioides sp.]
MAVIGKCREVGPPQRPAPGQAQSPGLGGHDTHGETTWWGAELKAVRLVPYRMDPVAFVPRVVIGDAAAGILADVRSTSTGPYAP